MVIEKFPKAYKCVKPKQGSGDIIFDLAGRFGLRVRW
jgi:hypothetical protein